MLLAETTWLLLGQEADGGGGGGLLVFAPFVIIVMLYIMLVHRPQRREQMVRQSMLANLKKNDHVLLTSGIYGVVTNVRADADEVTVRVDDSSNTRLRVTRSAVARVIGDESAPQSEGSAATGGA